MQTTPSDLILGTSEKIDIFTSIDDILSACNNIEKRRKKTFLFYRLFTDFDLRVINIFFKKNFRKGSIAINANVITISIY